VGGTHYEPLIDLVLGRNFGGGLEVLWATNAHSNQSNTIVPQIVNEIKGYLHFHRINGEPQSASNPRISTNYPHHETPTPLSIIFHFPLFSI
jgi:hypothetical protein